ncbi:formate dehydrogenase subunit gamma [Caminibacter mediatlanticus TB-2]|uniref:Formate dehydrogenase subunit gamma n=2 Tax=Caminibacter mediatlanticus TaxID=291048 RepID=A0ABX5VCD0_9BACT|nr:formate dehydrogenase subunit gamma [Caminibacter mediatlanticus TB-2]
MVGKRHIKEHLMKKIYFLLFSSLTIFAGEVPLASPNLAPTHPGSQLYKEEMIEAIPFWNKFGELFVYVQTHYTKPLFLAILIGVPLAFAFHYFVWGPKKFSHKGRKFLIFPKWQRIVHWIAALGFIFLVPTGFLIIYAKYFGGGEPIRFARTIHDIGAILFAIAFIPMMLMWFKDMLPKSWDLKWLGMLGGYLSKEKKEIPAHKFNAGQKMWYWTIFFGGALMLLTGFLLYIQTFDKSLLNVKIFQIDILRIAILTHLALALIIVALFFTHLYMSLFAIKGAVDSMISGCKSEDELKHLHSIFYKDIINKKIDKKLEEGCK